MQIERVNPILGSDTEHAVYLSPTFEHGNFIGSSHDGGSVGKVAVIHGLPEEVCSNLKEGNVLAIDEYLPLREDGSGTRDRTKGIHIYIKGSSGSSEGVSDITEVIPFAPAIVEREGSLH